MTDPIELTIKVSDELLPVFSNTSLIETITHLVQVSYDYGHDEGHFEAEEENKLALAQAWDEGYSHCFDLEKESMGVSLNDNPYRKETE